MKKKVITGIAVGLALLFVCSTAYSWNYATHAYIAAKIGKMLPLANCNEMYGLMAPDIFNFEFSLMADMNLRGYYNFMNVWYSANWGLKKSAAFGFVAHNDAWAADFVAHWRALPTTNPIPPDPIPFPVPFAIRVGHPAPTLQPPGYVIYLAAALDAGLAANNVWILMDIEDDYATRLMFCHNIIEYAGDLVLKRNDRLIGQKLVLACALRTPAFANLLKDGFDHLYDPLVTAGEPAYRKMLMQYGLILLMPENTAIEMLANQLADLAINYFEFLNPGYPPGSFDGLKPQLVEFGVGALTASIDICENADSYLGHDFPSYMQELNMVTIPWVKAQLLAHGVTY